MWLWRRRSPTIYCLQDGPEQLGKKKKKKGIQIRKEVKLSLFANKILYMENTKDSTRKTQ